MLPTGNNQSRRQQRLEDDSLPGSTDSCQYFSGSQGKLLYTRKLLYSFTIQDMDTDLNALTFVRRFQECSYQIGVFSSLKFVQINPSNRQTLSGTSRNINKTLLIVSLFTGFRFLCLLSFFLSFLIFF